MAMSRSAESTTVRASHSTAVVWGPLLAVYLIWGTTYLAIRVVNETMPPLLSAGVRFVVAGAALYLWAVRRGDRDGERLVVAGAATVAGFIAFERFVSPQYLVWLLPLVVLVAPPAGIAAAAVLAGAFVLGQLWFFHYRELFALEDVAWLVLARDLLLVALYGILVVAVLRLRTTIPSSSSAALGHPCEQRPQHAARHAAVEADDLRSR